MEIEMLTSQTENTCGCWIQVVLKKKKGEGRERYDVWQNVI